MASIKPNLLNLKTKFTDIRYGYVMVAPIITYSNFILIAYNFTFFKEMPFWMFTIIFSIGALGCLITLGKIFRKNQLEVDEDLRYEQAKQQARTNRIILLSCYDLLNDIELKKQVLERIKYLEQIEYGKKD